MRRSFLLAHLTRLLMPMLALASIFFLVRGHDLPGGGFIGGLLLATAFLLEGLSEGAVAARRALRIKPEVLIVSGLLLALLAGVSGLVSKGIFLKALWWQAPAWMGGLKVGSPFFFDLGVYFVVSGTVLMIYFSIKEG
jgi:multicomponent Na+:H+ antiporter subunit B